MIDEETKRLAGSLYQFIKDKYGFDTDPKITFSYNKENASKHLGMTGHYDPETEEVVIYAERRHPKDILRSLAHELIHHVQKFEGMMTPDQAAPESDPNYIVHDKFLEEVERDAFARGNVDLRFWEAGQKMSKQDKKHLHEGEKKKHTQAQIDTVHQRAAAMEKEKGIPTEKAFKFAWAGLKKHSNRKKKEQDEQFNHSQYEGHIEESMYDEQVEEGLNPALRDSVVYRPEDRSCNDLYSERETAIFQELLKKFNIKK